MGPACCQVRAPPPRVGLVDGVVQHRREAAQATLAAGIRALAEERHHEQVQGSPVPLQREVHHRLAELVLAIDVLHAVGLIHDVHQMDRFCGAPEHLAGARQERPSVAQPQGAGLAHIEMRATPVVRVQAQHGGQAQLRPVSLRPPDELRRKPDRRREGRL